MMENIYLEAIRLLEAGQSLVMLTIIDGGGSMPRSPGSKMIMRQDGSIFATIGGGKLEAVAKEKARGVFVKRKPCFYRFDLTGEDIANTEMICGGKGIVLLDYVTDNDLQVYRAAQNALENGKKGWLVTVIDNRKDVTLNRQFGFVTKDKRQVIGNFKASKDVLDRILDAAGGPHMHTEEIDGLLYCYEPVHSGGNLYLLGAGYVAREVAKIADLVGFKTIVWDDREEFANTWRFPSSECRVIPSYEDLPRLSLGSNDYIVIVTRGHLHDLDCLRWALRTNAAYIGMIGSRKKRDLIFDRLIKEGFYREEIERVHSPIGLDIGAETPSEIAVSIVGELIQVRVRQNG
jgi:xanthine dehydrogenase accessory factor